MDYTPAPNIETTLPGLTLAAIKVGDESVEMTTREGRSFQLYHDQDCCESVVVHDTQGDPQALVGSPLTEVKERAVEWSDGGERPEGWPADIDRPSESGTVTTFTLTTAQGSVVIRWVGESNGYYSESVSFVETT